MNRADVRKIVREELSKVEITFSIKHTTGETDNNLVDLVAKLSLPKELSKPTFRAGNDNDR
jgi:hypothetical protein